MAAQAEQLKIAKYAHSDLSHHFVCAFCGGSITSAGGGSRRLARELGRCLQDHWRILQLTIHPGENACISITVQKGNTAAVLGIMGRLDS